MAGHLIDGGHEVRAYDLRPEAVDAAAGDGAVPVDGPSEAAAGADVVFLSLPSPTVVEEVVEEIGDVLAEGTILIDTSTSAPATTETIAARLADRGVETLGAPVSGGRSGAEKGRLSVMVGGDRGAYAEVQPLLDEFAVDTFHVGTSPGHGHAVKLLNNYLSFTALVATSEAVALGQKTGLDPETLVDVFNVSTGCNSATDVKFPEHVLTGAYDTGFPMELMEKDVRLFAQLGEQQDAPLLLGSTVRQLIGYARSDLGPDADMTRLYEYVESTIARDKG
jgi:3-hydroxyisobutyrate dehydrogenase